MEVQWLRIQASTARVTGSIPGWGTKMPCSAAEKKKKKKKNSYLKWITNKDLLCSTWYSAQCYVAAWMGEEFAGEWINVYMYG